MHASEPLAAKIGIRLSTSHDQPLLSTPIWKSSNSIYNGGDSCGNHPLLSRKIKDAIGFKSFIIVGPASGLRLRFA
jgi:hypothetical protein